MNYQAKFLRIDAIGELQSGAVEFDASPNESRFVQRMEYLLESGVKAVTLLPISDQGQPSYNADLAEKLAKMGMPCFGCIPDRLPDLLAAVLKGQDLSKFAEAARLK